MNEKLTNGLHDELWIKGARALPDISTVLYNTNVIARTANAIECIKELYKMEALSKEDYIKSLKVLLETSGYKPVDKL